MRRQKTGSLLLSSCLIWIFFFSGCSQPPATVIPPAYIFVPSPAQIPVSIQPPTPSDILAGTPPMGWNSWNHFACSINEDLVRKTADVMVESGMASLGYEYVNIDDCWMAKTRDANGNLQPDPAKFPHGMKTLADYIHSKGLKLGIYLDRGTETCSHFPGSYGYEIQDANQVASWGIDYVKYDNCAVVGKLMDDYTKMHNALVATGRPIVFSMCSWGFPGMLVAELDIAQLWRTSSDIKDTWDSMIKIGEANNAYSLFAQPGHWNDPDMLEVGNGGMTDTEYKTHFSLWAMMAAPLIAGNDLLTMDQATRDILTAAEVIAVDQDPLGIQGTFLSNLATVEGFGVWSKPLVDPGTRAVMLLNRSEIPATISIHWKDIGLPEGPAAVRDLWERADRGIFYNGYGSVVASHGVILLKVHSVKLPSPTPLPPL
jgi:alpha-galactosidase